MIRSGAVLMRSVWSLPACVAFVVVLAAGLAPPGRAETSERYQLELFITWSSATHPHGWPADGAGLSELAGTTHKAGFSLFRDGAPASAGLRQLAETGGTSLFGREFETGKLTGQVGETFAAGPLKAAPGYVKVEFDASLAHPQVSFAAALMPSPDWFTGAAAIPLRTGGEWRDSIEFPLFAWDAGTDDGNAYAAENASASPPQSVRLLASPHVMTRKGLLPLGRAVLTRIF